MSSEIETLATQSATEIGAAIEAGRADPRALTELYLERAAAAPRIYVRLTPERARREAAAAQDRAARGLRRHPLDGVPISWKDLFDVAGVATEAGGRLLEGEIADQDAPVVANTAHAGLVCLGKTHLSELAFSGLGYNPVTATPPNRYDPDCAPGGSSSGAAASVVAGCAAVGIGSDTGGSVRIPSAWNGLVGLKTPIGSLPMEGVRPLSPSLDTIGPLARTVSDAALTVSALRAEKPVDLTAAPTKGLRVLVTTTIFTDDLAPARAEAFESALAALAAAGVEIVRRADPELSAFDAFLTKNGALVAAEGYAAWRDRLEAAPERVYERILERFRSGAGKGSDDSEASRLEIGRQRVNWRRKLAGFDALVAPTTPNDPPKVTVIAENSHSYTTENFRALRNTRIGNLLNFVSISLPTPPAAGSPFAGALMISAPADREARLLRVAAALEPVLRA